jgi:hypothetical protein
MPFSRCRIAALPTLENVVPRSACTTAINVPITRCTISPKCGRTGGRQRAIPYSADTTELVLSRANGVRAKIKANSVREEPSGGGLDGTNNWVDEFVVL